MGAGMEGASPTAPLPPGTSLGRSPPLSPNWVGMVFST